MAPGTLDGWITDSEAWVPEDERARVSKPLAYSPVVLAVPPSVKVPAGGRLTAEDVDRLSAGPLRFSEPAESTPSLLALMALRQDGGAGSERAVRRLSRRTVSESELESSLHAKPGQAMVFPTTEQRLVQLSRQRPDTLTAASLPGRLPVQVYSLVTRTTDPERAKALADLAASFGHDSVRRLLAEDGFRTDMASSPPTTVPGVPPSGEPLPPLTGARVLDTMNIWAGARRDGRYVVAIDTSGSMNAAASGGRRRIELATAALDLSLAAVPETSEVGLWAFDASTRQGGQDWRELVPMVSLEDPSARDRLTATGRRLADPANRPTGGTGLYDTIVAAYQSVRDRADSRHEGIALVLTDGRNDDDSGGRDLQQALTELRSLQDPERPVRLVLVGVGDEPDRATLDTLAASVGGLSYTSATAEGLADVLPRALTLQLTDETR